MRSYLPRVSIIIPTYNRPRLLQTAVESALAQTYPAVEIIVVDDGSTDHTAAAVARYAGRVTYIRQANQDVAAARNTGIRASSGEYLTFLDDDDLIMPTKIARQVQLLASRLEAGLVHCRFYYTNEAGEYLHKAGLLPEGEVLERLVCSNFVWVGAPLVRRECFDQVGLFDEGVPAVTADWDMWLRIAQAGYRFACVQEPLGAYRIHGSSMMSDVAKLEHGVFTTLDKAFSDSHMPVHVRALKEQVYGRIRFWISCRYYAAGQWDDARRNMTAALASRPHLRQPDQLSRLLCDDALSPRVEDPFRFIAGVLDHLPAGLDGLQRYRPQLLSQIYAELAMRSYGTGDIAQAQRQLTEAMALDPTRSESAADFARLVCYCAMHLPLSTPFLYVDTVLDNLPPQAQRLRRVRRRVLGDINVKCAFQDYSMGQRGRAARRILTALRYRPAWIRNRGVVSILLRSLPALMAKEDSQH